MNWRGASAGLSLLAAGALLAAEKEIAPGIFQVGTIDHPNLRECSGVAPSQASTNVYWMHSDGRRPVLYAVSRAGQSVREFIVDAPALQDWEDIASDHHGFLYLADTGNNEAVRDRLAVYQFREPDPAKGGGLLPVTRSWLLRFPGQPFDCESLFIWQDHGYVIAKLFEDSPAAVYRFPLKPARGPVTLEFVTRLAVTSPVTGADLSADGQKLVLTAKNGVYLFNKLGGDVAKAGQMTPRFARFKDKHIEGCCFAPDGILVTAETRQIYRFTDRAFEKGKGKGKGKAPESD